MSRRMTRRNFLVLAAAAALGTAASACGATPTATPTRVPPTATKPPAAPAPTVAPTKAPATVGKEGGTLRAAFTATYDDLNPMVWSGRGNIDVARRVFSCVTQFDASGDLIGDLAEKWSRSSDGKTLTFNLRKGVKWHDGTPLTSKDVEYTFRMNASPKTNALRGSNLAAVVGYDEANKETTDKISGITTPDANTVVIQLKAPSAYFLAGLTKIYVVPEHILGKTAPADLPKHPMWSSLLIGTGPYKMTKYVPKQVIEYERNVDYHLGRPKIEKMVWSIIAAADTQLLAFEKGELDYAFIGLNKDTMDRVKKTPHLYVKESNEPRATFLSINTKRFSDLRVRQAFCYAIDMSALVDANGGPEVAKPGEYFFVNPWITAKSIKFSDVYKYDPKKAKALLDEAKWDPNKEVEILTKADSTGKAAPVDILIIQEQWQAVGIKTKIRLVDAVTPFYTEGNYDFTHGGPAYDDPYPVAAAFSCAAVGKSGTSYAQYCNPEFDKLVDQDVVAPDQASRVPLYVKMQEILIKDAVCYLKPIQPNRALFNKRVHADRWAWYWLDDSWNWWID